MTAPEPEEKHDIADTQMFRRFAAKETNSVAQAATSRVAWIWGGVAVLLIIVLVLWILLVR